MTYPEAIDELFGICKAAVDAAVVAGIVPSVQQRWPGNPQPGEPPTDAFWSRASYQTVTDEQSTLSNAGGKRRYEANGLFYLQIFCPLIVANALPNGRLLAQAVQAAFRRSSPSGVMTFHASPIRELPNTNEAYPLTLMVKCNYDNIQ